MVSQEIGSFAVISLILISAVTLIYGAVRDSRKRSVNPFLFVPIMAAGVVINILISSPIFFIILAIASFILSFLRPSGYAYLISGLLMFIAAFIVTVMSTFPIYGFEFLIISVIFLTGFQQRLFGIGDTKAIISLIFSFTGVNISLIRGVAGLNGLIANGIFILFYIVLASLVFLLAEFFHISAAYGKFGAKGFRIPYSKEAENAVGNAFMKRRTAVSVFLVYRVPFLIPVAAGFFLFIIFGSLFL